MTVYQTARGFGFELRTKTDVVFRRNVYAYCFFFPPIRLGVDIFKKSFARETVTPKVTQCSIFRVFTAFHTFTKFENRKK